jgi:hypothetical protein
MSCFIHGYARHTHAVLTYAVHANSVHIHTANAYVMQAHVMYAQDVNAIAVHCKCTSDMLTAATVPKPVFCGLRTAYVKFYPIKYH